MLPLEARQFSTFGRCAHWPRIRPRLGGFALAASRRDSRRMLRQICPKRPGVYGMLDERGKLIYVGKSKSLRDRLLAYLQTEPADPKAGRIIEATERLIWEPLPGELPALVRELELIRRWRPEYNVRGQPGLFRRVYLCLGRGPAPHAYIAPQATQRAGHVFGPLPSSEMLREAVRYVNTRFKLRDCPERVPMVFADQLELFDADRRPQCTRFELGTCPAPCAAGCTKRAYGRLVSHARAFLDGDDPATLEQLEQAMLAAAEERRFERAANLRDVWAPLFWLNRQLKALREARRRSSFVATLTGGGRRRYWLVVNRGAVADLMRAPRDQRSAERAAQRLDAIFGDSSAPHETPEDMEHMLLVQSWFRAHPEARQAALEPESALALCRQTVEARL